MILTLHGMSMDRMSMEGGQYVAELNQHAQQNGSDLRYEDLGSTGPDNDKTFTLRVIFNGVAYPEGVGKTKKKARNHAAENALKCLLGNQQDSESLENSSVETKNFIAIVNSYCQKTHSLPNYVSVDKSGPSHDPVFRCRLVIDGTEYPVGEGKRAQKAKQEAARLAWTVIKEQSDYDSQISVRSTMSEDDDQPMLSAPPSIQHSSDSSSQSCSMSTTASSQSAASSRPSLQDMPQNMATSDTSDWIEFRDSSNPADNQVVVEEGNTPTQLRFTLDYDSIEPLGKGGFGRVYKARQKLLERFFAIKVVRYTEKALREARALSELQHQNIVQYYNCWQDPEYQPECSADSCSNSESFKSSSQQCLYIVMELCDTQTLTHWISERNNITVKDLERREESLKIVQQIACGVAYIHSQNLIHRDLKPDNIMFGQKGEVKIVDFGLVTTAADDDEILMKRTKEKGTISYMAPEQQGDNYDDKVDIFALGLIYFELLWKVSTGHERIEMLKNAKRQNFPPQFERTFFQENLIIKLMLCENPQKRPDASTVMAELGKKDLEMATV